MRLFMRTLCQTFAATGLLFSSANVLAENPELQAVQIYSQDELIKLINKNEHLTRVKLDDCQLVQDIEARASKMKIPAYQFLYGDMLAYAVCVERDVDLGVYYMREAADQGLAAALEQLGRYYHVGQLVQRDINKAIIYLREAASLGNLNAQIRLVDLFNAGLGSPRDFEDAYRWLNGALIYDKKRHQEVAKKLALLAEKMPPSALARAKK
ncbi:MULTISPECIES: tetratricopeptide repeat protein [Pseudoalteromonas]|uniref:tetratricopeptide repeat protein n=1 Tax=Pseudoalteromonas TaxID=53246 RepID=UPI000C2CF9F4|nr:MULTISPECIES: tetratricopeptide repeat protein [Pseudoalteromonas]